MRGMRSSIPRFPMMVDWSTRRARLDSSRRSNKIQAAAFSRKTQVSRWHRNLTESLLFALVLFCCVFFFNTTHVLKNSNSFSYDCMIKVATLDIRQKTSVIIRSGDTQPRPKSRPQPQLPPSLVTLNVCQKQTDWISRNKKTKVKSTIISSNITLNRLYNIE